VTPHDPQIKNASTMATRARGRAEGLDRARSPRIDPCRTWFAKAARKAGIDDAELCRAIAEARKGQADDLGGGVFKKRLDKNRSRSIILAKGRVYWVYEYLFAKKDRDNIDDKELAAFRKLAGAYEGLDDQ